MYSPALVVRAGGPQQRRGAVGIQISEADGDRAAVGPLYRQLALHRDVIALYVDVAASAEDSIGMQLGMAVDQRVAAAAQADRVGADADRAAAGASARRGAGATQCHIIAGEQIDLAAGADLRIG